MDKFAIILALVCTIFAGITKSSPTSEPIVCEKFDQVLEELSSAQAMTVLSEKYLLPTTIEDLEKKCVDSRAAIKTLRMYNTKCNKALTQQVFKALLDTRHSLIDETCKTIGGDKFNAVLASLKCVKDNAFENVKQAEIKTALGTQVLLDANVEPKERVSRACCGVLESRKDFFNATKDKCSAYEKIYSEYVDSYTSESVGVLCQDFDKLEKSDECSKLSVLKTEGVVLRSKSFLSPMIDLVKSLDR